MRIAPVFFVLGALCSAVPAFAVPVANVQRGTFSLPATSSGPASVTRTTVTINPVDLASSVLTFSYAVNSADPENGHVRATLENATTVSFERAVGGTAVTGFFSVVQFASGAVVQRGVDDVPTTLTKTLTTIDPAKSFVMLSWQGTGNTYGDDDFFTGELTGATSLVLSQANTAGGTKKVSWQVVQLSDAKVQRGVANLATTVSSTAVTFPTAIVANKSFPLLTWTTGGSNTSSNFPTAAITNSAITISRKLAATALRVAWEVVESTDSGVTVQAVTPTLGTSATTMAQAITNAPLDRSMTILPTMGGRGGGADNVNTITATAATDSIATTMVSIEKTAQNSLTLTRAASGSSNDVNLWEVLFPAAANVGVTGSVSANPVVAGASTTWTFNVFSGSANASTVSLTVDLPPGSGTPSAAGGGWTCNVTAGATPQAVCTRAALNADLTSAVTVTATAPKTGGGYSATATVSASNDTIAFDNTATVQTTVTPSADLAIGMTATPSAGIFETQSLSYKVLVVNNGPSAANGVSVVDTLPAGATLDSAAGIGWTCLAPSSGQVTCTHGALAQGETALELVIKVTIPAGQTSAVNSAVASATETDPTPGNNTATVTTTVSPASNLSVTLTAAPNPVNAGDKVTFTATVSNAGPSASTPITLNFKPKVNEATKPSGFTCANGTFNGDAVRQCTGTIAAGASGVFTFEVVATPDAATVDGSVSVSATNDLAGGDSASASVDVQQVANVGVVKTASKAKYLVGDSIPYTLAVSNAGPSSSGPLTLTDTLPTGVTFTSATGAGWTCNAAGGVVTCTHAGLAGGQSSPVTLTVGTPSTQKLAMSNTASVAVATPIVDPVATNDSSTVVVDVAASADVGVTLAASKTTVAAGDGFTLTVTAKNLGPNTATNAKVTLTLPAAVATPAVLPLGCSAKSAAVLECIAATLTTTADAVWTLAFTAPGVAADTNLAFSAAIAAAETDTKTGNDTASATVKATPVADVALSLTVTPNPARLSEGLTYTVKVENKGPSPVTGRVVELALDSTLTAITATGTGWTCNLAGTTVGCTRASFAAGAQPDISVTAKAPATAGTLGATAQAKTGTATTPDPVAANDSATADVVVGAPVLDVPGTKLVVSPAGEVKAGARLDYTVTVANTGQVPADNVAVKLELPEGASLVAGALTVPGTIPGTLAMGTIGPSAQKTFSFAFEVLRDNPGQVAVTAKISADMVAEFTRSVTNPVATDQLLGLALSAEPTELGNGQPTTLAATLSGGFVPDASELVLTLPDGLAPKGTTAKVGDADATLKVEGGKVTIPLAKTDAELVVKIDLFATEAAEGKQTVSAVAMRKDKPLSVEASAELNVSADYDLGGCGCSASGAPAGLALAVLGALALLNRRRRTT